MGLRFRGGTSLEGNIQYEVPTWNQLYDMLLSEAEKVHADGFYPDAVVAVARGGLVPGRIHADLLEVPNLTFIQVEFYLNISKTKPEPILKQALPTQVNGKKVLLVDDIADTGRSLQLAASYLKLQGAAETRTATLYRKPYSVVKPDFYEKETANWVIFPWDTKEMLRKIVQKQGGRRQVNQEIAKIIKSGLPKQLAERLLSGMQEP